MHDRIIIARGISIPDRQLPSGESAFGLKLRLDKFLNPRTSHVSLAREDLEIMAGTDAVVPSELQHKEAVFEAILISEKDRDENRWYAVLALVKHSQGVQLVKLPRVNHLAINTGNGWQPLDDARNQDRVIDPTHTSNLHITRTPDAIYVLTTSL